MASRYSWSSKRSYKNGYVWHDLCEHDLIFPVHGNEYVLKGSEFHEDDSTKVPKPLKQVPSPTCESSSSSSIMNKKTEHEDDSSSSPSPYKKHGVVDASTQTEVVPSKNGYADDGDRSCTGSSPSCSDGDGVTETTLETLIRGDASRIGSFRLDRDEGMKLQKLKPGNVLIQLISCGSVAVKDHNFGLIPIYGTGLSRPPLIDGELDLLPENSGLMRLKLEDKAYFSGSLVETTTTAMSSNPPPSLKRSSSYGAERRKAEDHEKRTSAHVRCIPRSMKREKRADSMRSPLSEAPRKSSGRMTAPSSSSASSSARPSKRIDSFLEDDHDVINIEES